MTSLSPERIAAINAARLDTAAGARVLGEVATDEPTWNAYVHPDVKDALGWVSAQAHVVGMPRDVLLSQIEHYLVQAEATRSRVMPVLEFIEGQLDLLVEQHRDAQIGAAAVAQRTSDHNRTAGKGRGKAISDAATKNDTAIRKYWRQWTVSEELQDQYPQPVQYVRIKTGLARATIYLRVKALGLKTPPRRRSSK
jgi:hypothetical protein